MIAVAIVTGVCAWIVCWRLVFQWIDSEVMARGLFAAYGVMLLGLATWAWIG